MTAKKIIEYSVSVPADSKASFRVNHTPGGTTCTIESEHGRYDVSTRQFDMDAAGEDGELVELHQAVGSESDSDWA